MARPLYVRPSYATHLTTEKKVGSAVYAIVKAGGRQYRVAVGDEVEVNSLQDQPGASVSLPAVLLVDGEKVTADAATLAKASVTAEVLDHTRGPKIKIHKYKNKTRYHKRQGHRQALTRLKVTGIESGK